MALTKHQVLRRLIAAGVRVKNGKVSKTDLSGWLARADAPRAFDYLVKMAEQPTDEQPKGLNAFVDLVTQVLDGGLEQYATSGQNTGLGEVTWLAQEVEPDFAEKLRDFTPRLADLGNYGCLGDFEEWLKHNYQLLSQKILNFYHSRWPSLPKDDMKDPTRRVFFALQRAGISVVDGQVAAADLDAAATVIADVISDKERAKRQQQQIKDTKGQPGKSFKPKPAPEKSERPSHLKLAKPGDKRKVDFGDYVMDKVKPELESQERHWPKNATFEILDRDEWYFHPGSWPDSVKMWAAPYHWHSWDGGEVDVPVSFELFDDEGNHDESAGHGIWKLVGDPQADAWSYINLITDQEDKLRERAVELAASHVKASLGEKVMAKGDEHKSLRLLDKLIKKAKEIRDEAGKRGQVTKEDITALLKEVYNVTRFVSDVAITPHDLDDLLKKRLPEPKEKNPYVEGIPKGRMKKLQEA